MQVHTIKNNQGAAIIEKTISIDTDLVGVEVATAVLAGSFLDKSKTGAQFAEFEVRAGTV